MLTIFTDTDTDITLQEAKKYGYKLISMPYSLFQKEVKPYEDYEEFDYKEFYNTLRKLKKSELPTTCAIGEQNYINYFEPELKKGNDILYVHFSRSMSASFDSMDKAIAKLKESYPERTIYTIDTKGITILSLNIVKEIGELYLQNKSVEEIIAWANENVDHFATYFFADDLTFFSKSGRISNFSKVFGNLFGIKPIIYMDDKGTMTNIGKEKGKQNALKKLLQYYDELSVDQYDHTVIIGHTDSLENASKLGDMLLEKYGPKLKIEYAVVNPTAGSHCGPDTIGISFYAKHK